MPHNVNTLNDAELSVAVLVSVGRHPLTGRARRADHDARAVEMALSLGDASVQLMHAGDGGEACGDAMRGYLGMGISRVKRINQDPDADVVPALANILRFATPQLVLTGTRAETGEGSGLVPYLLAETLGWTVVSGLAEIESIEQGVATVLQALPRGKRRRLKVRLPAIATVDSSAPAARQSAFGPARRGELADCACASVTDELQTQWRVQPARKRPKRLKIVKSASARDRFKAAAAKADSGGGQLLNDVTPEQGAEAIFTLLKEEGVLR
ncbi:electron transfer flavoprotein subunit beta [Halomonas sp. A40-4]|uniref:electron transfer flavoprotein subunit beta n=1 Tax=Halomonas sp. A40-4 TaxID=2785909 RepID=UPI0018EFC975|nr:electron transfer flavoprotein subunit beta [Halomonas sp. A40-4]QPL45783.1 electron transfer flavoprotein subunit beta [Halomonas sp. A40-4]